jgi:predicted ATP-grasp superfamily ATP-dependent carboligase
LAIARSLGRLGVPVHGVDIDLRTSAFASRYFVRRHHWDFAKASAASSVEFLLTLRTELGRHAVLIPTTDDTAQLVADYAAELRDVYHFQDNPPALVCKLRRKWELFALAKCHDVPTPDTLLPRSLQEAQRFADQIKYPLLLKASDGARLEARVMRKMVIVRTSGELTENYSRMEDPADPNLMLQEYIPGGDDAVWMFNGYFNRKSDCVAGFTGKKIRQHPIHTGATSLGICLRNDTVHELTTTFMSTLGYQGIIDMGYRYDARDGLYKLLDINPRIGATFRLFVGADGTDVARLLYLDLTDQPLPLTALVEGRRWLDENRDYFSSREYRREGSLTIATWLRSLRGVHETVWLARDDLIPAVLLVLEIAGRAIRKLWNRAMRPFLAAR